MPSSVGIRFSHAALQVIAEDNHVDLLHIKGPATDVSLGGDTRSSIDADVLVRPAHVERLVTAMRQHGWTTKYRFEDGSAFEHASTMVHPVLAPVDVHRRFPGVDADPSLAFDRLWADRAVADLAGLPCPVPSVTAQRLVLIVHAARAGSLTDPDITRAWVEADPAQRLEIDALADEVGATLALAAGTGRLEEHRGERGYELWRVLSTGEASRSRLWVARVKAAPTRRQAARTAVRLVLPNRHRMEASLGRPPTPSEVVFAYGRSARRAALELRRLVVERSQGRRGP